MVSRRLVRASSDACQASISASTCCRRRFEIDAREVTVEQARQDAFGARDVGVAPGVERSPQRLEQDVEIRCLRAEGRKQPELESHAESGHAEPLLRLWLVEEVGMDEHGGDGSIPRAYGVTSGRAAVGVVLDVDVVVLVSRGIARRRPPVRIETDVRVELLASVHGRPEMARPLECSARSLIEIDRAAIGHRTIETQRRDPGVVEEGGERSIPAETGPGAGQAHGVLLWRLHTRAEA